MDFSKLKRLPLGSITAEGFLLEQLLRSRDGMGGHMDELEPGVIADPYLRETHVDGWTSEDQLGWGAEISGNYWTGVILLAYTSGDAYLIEKANRWVDEVLKTRCPDGYLGTYRKPGANRFEDFNGWGTSRALLGLLAFYEATGRRDVLDAVHDCLLWFCKNWAGDRKTTYVGPTICDPMAECYFYTGDFRLVQFIEEYNAFLCTHDTYDSSAKSFLEKGLIYNSNHTVALGALAKLPALEYSMTGEQEKLRASEKILDEIYTKATHLSGSPVSITEFVGPVSSTAETEYCNYTIYHSTFSGMARISGNSKYGDRMEELFYNGAQGARKKDERAIAYLSAPNQIYATESSSSAYDDMQAYAPCYPTACCPANSVVLLGAFVRDMAFTDDSGNLYINVYGPCRINNGAIRLREETEYPFRDTVRFLFERDAAFRLHLRIPDWCREFEVKVNGECIPAERGSNGFVTVQGDWHCGDVVSIRFKMEVAVRRVDDSDASKKYPIAIQRGPLLFSLHIPEKWEPYPGRPITPLPKGWSWYNVNPIFEDAPIEDFHEMMGTRRETVGWNIALSETLSPDDITVEEIDADGYVWENPRIKLHLTGYKAPYLCSPYPKRTFEPFGDRQIVTSPVPITLEPYGCTNLRITYFPRAKL